MAFEAQNDTIDVSTLSTTTPSTLDLDLSITDLQTQLRRLRSRLAQHTSEILSLTSKDSISTFPPLSGHLATQHTHSQTTLSRLTSSITTFTVQDPDPNAVNHRKVFALRFESWNKFTAKFQLPYYVFLNKPFTDKGLVKVHRHTLPPAINISELSKRYLPSPKSSEGQESLKAKKQNVKAFAEAVRREIVGFNARMAVVRDMRMKCGLEGGKKALVGGVLDVSVIDAEAKQIRIAWNDGRIGRVVVGEKGTIRRCVVHGEQGRDGVMERKIMGNSIVEGLIERLS